MTWLVGITTCPRPGGVEYLSRTVAACKAAGWLHPMIHEDPDRSGAWRAWLACLKSLVDLDATAGCFMLLQDDVLLARGVRAYLEKTDALYYPDCLLTLYTSAVTAGYAEAPECWMSRQQPQEPGWRRMPASWLPRRFAGACAIAMNRTLADALLRHHTGHQPANQADWQIGQFCLDHYVTPVFHVPSLSEHIGTTSVVFAPENAGPILQGPLRFAGKWCQDVSQLESQT